MIPLTTESGSEVRSSTCHIAEEMTLFFAQEVSRVCSSIFIRRNGHYTPYISTILCGTHRQFATDETRASVVAFSFLVRLVDRLTQRFLLCHFRRGTRNRMLPLARCAIAALQHRTLTSLWPSSSQPRRLGGPCGVGYTAAQAWPCEPPHFPHHSLAGQGSRQRGGFPAYLSGSVAAEGASP